jgi:hypothetical protein
MGTALSERSSNGDLALQLVVTGAQRRSASAMKFLKRLTVNNAAPGVNHGQFCIRKHSGRFGHLPGPPATDRMFDTWKGPETMPGSGS